MNYEVTPEEAEAAAEALWRVDQARWWWRCEKTWTDLPSHRKGRWRLMAFMALAAARKANPSQWSNGID